MIEAETQGDPEVVVARIAYLAAGQDHAGYRVWPPSSGRPIENPPKEHHEREIRDCRPLAATIGLDDRGFRLLASPAGDLDFYDDAAVRERYYAEVEALIAEAAGAERVFAFDHNVRSAKGAAEGRPGVRLPVDMAHDDYTESSGPKRAREILEAAGRADLVGRPAALINAWRPIRGPVEDVPLAICDATSASPRDFVDTDIEHYAEEDLSRPRHVGRIYSLRFNPEHRWWYARGMGRDEVMLLKCWDSRTDGRARYTAHTGFRNPEAPADAIPRESIEVRTLAVF
jgi:hypothetical protein